MLVAALLAQEPAAEFRRGLESISALTGKGQWKEALAELELLLNGHESADYARRARSEIIMVSKRCRFHLAFQPPKPQDLISGKIVSLDLKRSFIHLQYDESCMGDFEDLAEKGIRPRVHPAVFRSYRITIKGSRYERGQLLTCMGSHSLGSPESWA